MVKVDPKNQYSGLTMTVGELIGALSAYSRDMPVIATWEGVGAGFRTENFSTWDEEGREELVIDVERYG